MKPDEAQAVLNQLLALHPELAGEAEEIAQVLLSDVSFEAVADEVESALRFPDLDDLNARAGPSRWGYTPPDEAAWELLEEALQPFIDEMTRYVELAMEKQALEICQGILLGLYRLRDAEDHEVLQWAADFPFEVASRVVKTWSEAKRPKDSAEGASHRHPTLPRDFVSEHLPEWQDLITK
ncbi:MAG: hypothetical protein AB1609_15045 [Bacillota bacterium]